MQAGTAGTSRHEWLECSELDERRHGERGLQDRGKPGHGHSESAGRVSMVNESVASEKLSGEIAVNLVTCHARWARVRRT